MVFRCVSTPPFSTKFVTSILKVNLGRSLSELSYWVYNSSALQRVNAVPGRAHVIVNVVNSELSVGEQPRASARELCGSSLFLLRLDMTLPASEYAVFPQPLVNPK
jgi:hypothetical protein